MRTASALRAIAVVEAAKGGVVLLAGFALFSLIHHDVQRFAEQLVAHAHLNPAARTPRIFLELARAATDARLQLLSAGAAAYAVVRFVEAYGLWFARRWAEWFAALSGAVYIPFELLELYKRASWLSIGALAVNAAIVAVALHAATGGGRQSPRAPG